MPGAETGPDPAPDGGAGLRFFRTVGRLLQRLPRRLSWAPALAWMAVIWGLSSLPSGTAGTSWSWSWLNNFGHAPVFGLLALWLVLGLPREHGWPRFTRKGTAGILAAVLVYGCIDELHQSLTPGRIPSVFDILTDVVGACATLWMIHYIGRARAREGGLWARITLGLAVCLATALFSTFRGPH